MNHTSPAVKRPSAETAWTSGATGGGSPVAGPLAFGIREVSTRPVRRSFRSTHRLKSVPGGVREEHDPTITTYRLPLTCPSSHAGWPARSLDTTCGRCPAPRTYIPKSPSSYGDPAFKMRLLVSNATRHHRRSPSHHRHHYPAARQG